MQNMIAAAPLLSLRRRDVGRVLLVCVVAFCLMSWSPAARAQSSDLESLSQRVEQLQRELQDLRQAIYNAEAPAATEGGASGAGMTNVQAARLNLRLSQFESALRTLTNQVEEMGFAVDRVNMRLDSLVADVDRRLQALEGGSPAAAATAPASAPTATSTAEAGGQPRVLGTVSQSDVESFQGTRVEPTAQVSQDQQAAMTTGTYQLPEGSIEDQYKHAFALLRQANYAEAEQALGAFIDRYPDDPLAGNAQYWLGETYYVRGDYQQAAVTFAEAYKNYPNGAKAPDNLLKLGLSLASLGNSADACGTFAELMRRYQETSPGIVRRARTESQKLNCS